jgi:hypothetical protein
MDIKAYYLMEQHPTTGEWWTCGGPYANLESAEAARVDLRGLSSRIIEIHEMTIHNQKEVDKPAV